jgi:DNA/RNA-binding domain of Phe-tRNA-synthetase-like protein
MESINVLIDEYNSIMNNYKLNIENRELLRDAVRLQIREITPEMENLRRLKNELNEVDVVVNTIGNVYDINSTLVQRKVTLANIDVTLEEPPRVVKFSKKA